MRVKRHSGHLRIVLIYAELERRVAIEHVHYAHFVVAEVELNLAQIHP